MRISHGMLQYSSLAGGYGRGVMMMLECHSHLCCAVLTCGAGLEMSIVQCASSSRLCCEPLNLLKCENRLSLIRLCRLRVVEEEGE